MNYVQLQQIIQDYAENTESLFVTNIPKFVEQAEARIYNMVQIPSLRKNVTGTMTASNQYLSLPNDWLATYSVAAINPTTGVYTYLIMHQKYSTSNHELVLLCNIQTHTHTHTHTHT